MSKKYNEKGEELFKAGSTYITKEEAVYVQAFHLARERDTLKEENKELRKRIRELENDSSCKNCGAGKGRVGCGKDCFQDDDKRDT